MAEPNIVGSLFGVTPELYQEQRDLMRQKQAMEFAQQDPRTQATYAFGRAGQQLGQALGGLMGAEDPQMRLISQRNALAKQFDVSTPEGLAQYGQALQQAGDTQGALGAIGISRQMTQEMALTGQRQAAERSSLATAAKTELSIEQEKKLRDELSRLPTNATEEQILGVVTKYGSPDKVLAVLQGTADKAAQRETALTLGREKIAAKVEEDLRRAKNDQEREQIRIEGRKDLALLVASLKGPSAAVIKAQERADKIAEGQAGLEDTINVAKTLVKDLADMGGMTSTSKGPLSNLITSLQTGTVGQIGGRLVGTKEQAKRDELKSVRLQLLNAVKEATGMSSTQLNSNVELKTYLDSLGSEGMTKEANEAILNNIANRYLRGTKTEPSGNAPKGTAANPIVLK
jgi:hypothetical protein